MSRSDLNLQLIIHSPHPNATITVLDGYGQTISSFQGSESKTLHLTKGIYALRTNLSGVMEERFIQVRQNQEETAPLPRLYSSAPQDGFENTEAYFQEPAVEWSNKPTYVHNWGNLKADSALYFFVRLEQDAIPFAESLQSEFELYQHNQEHPSKLEIVSQFTSHQTVSLCEDGFAWFVLSMEVPAGLYVLRYLGTPTSANSPTEPFGRDVPIYAWKGYQTQAFLSIYSTYSPPDFSGMKMLVAEYKESHKEGFVPSKSISQKVDLGQHILLEQDFTPHDNELSTFINDSSPNPLFGLIASYMALQNLTLTFENESDERDDILRSLEILKQLIPDSPDLHALEVAVDLRLHTNLTNSFQLVEPPMLQIGLDAILEASVSQKVILGKDSLAQHAVTHVIADSPWVSWPFEPNPVQLESFLSPRTETNIRRGPASLNWIQAAILDYIEKGLRPSKKSKLRKQILPLSSDFLTSRLQLPSPIIEQSIQELEFLSPPAKSKVKEDWPLFIEEIEKNRLSADDIYRGLLFYTDNDWSSNIQRFKTLVSKFVNLFTQAAANQSLSFLPEKWIQTTPNSNSNQVFAYGDGEFIKSFGVELFHHSGEDTQSIENDSLHYRVLDNERYQFFFSSTKECYLYISKVPTDEQHALLHGSTIKDETVQTPVSHRINMFDYQFDQSGEQLWRVFCLEKTPWESDLSLSEDLTPFELITWLHLNKLDSSIAMYIEIN